MIGYQLTLNAARHPDAVALVFGARRLTYAALEERACRLANGLAALGAGRGDRVAALLHNCNPFVEALFATAKLGAVFVPINFRLVAREVGALLDACGPKVLLAGEGFADLLTTLEARPNFPGHRIWVDDRLPAEPSPDPAHPYEAWLAGESPGGAVPAVASGEQLFVSKSCNTCHRADSSARAPILNGLFGTQVTLQDGTKATANEDYIRESILNPAAKIVQGYQPVMPTFKGQVTEEELIQLVNYVKTLKAPGGGAAEVRK